MKKMKKLVIAGLIGLLGLTGATAATSGVAWFTASNTVQVTGLEMKAAAEQGIVISNEAAEKSWKTTTTASHSGAEAAFVPTSTATTGAWYHAYADDANNGQSGVQYTTITPADNDSTLGAEGGTEGDGVWGFNENGTWKNVYLLNKFYIKSSSASTIANQDIYVCDVTFTTPAQELSKALRVAFVKQGASTPLIVAAHASSTASYTVHNDTATTAKLPAATDSSVENFITVGSKDVEIDSNVTIPAFSTNAPLEYDVYCYYEGEDTACKSANIVATLESVNISFKFGNKNHD